MSTKPDPGNDTDPEEYNHKEMRDVWESTTRDPTNRDLGYNKMTHLTVKELDEDEIEGGGLVFYDPESDNRQLESLFVGNQEAIYDMAAVQSREAKDMDRRPNG